MVREWFGGGGADREGKIMVSRWICFFLSSFLLSFRMFERGMFMQATSVFTLDVDANRRTHANRWIDSCEHIICAFDFIVVVFFFFLSSGEK